MHAGLKSKLVALALMGLAVGLAACAKDVEHGGFGIDRVDVAGRTDGAREARREVAGPRAHFRDHLSAAQLERAHERRRLLPLRALRIELALERAVQLLGRHFFFPRTF